MPTARFIQACLVFCVSIVALYVLEITFGGAMDAMYIQFYNLVPTLHMSTGWQAQSIGVLGGWKWFYRSVVVIIIALGVWVVKTAIFDQPYAKEGKGN